LAVRLEGLYWEGNKVGCSFFLWTLGLAFGASHYDCPSREAVRVHGQRFGLWTLGLEASHYARPKAPIPIFYWLFSAHFFGLSTKFGHSIPRPLDLDGHSAKRPLISILIKMDSMSLSTMWKIVQCIDYSYKGSYDMETRERGLSYTSIPLIHPT
jgi:hypothetical protein